MSHRDPVDGLLGVGGKYRVLDRLGGGSVGEVFRGENTLTGRPVALKIIRGDLAEDRALVTGYFQEVQAANRIRHPNIVDVLDLDAGESGTFVVMQCLSGESSAEVVHRRGKLTIEAAVAIGTEVLDALDAAHRAGIVHRNLKPANLFLHRPTADALVAVKLLDFGIARLLGAAGMRAHTPTVLEAADYLSPERVLGESSIDGRSDLFSIAAVLFELLTGQAPFRAATATMTAQRVAHAPAPSFAGVGGPSHPMLESIIGKALGKRPADRYTTAADFARELLHVAPDARTRERALQEIESELSVSVEIPAFATLESSGSRRPSAPPPPGATSRFPSGPPSRASSSGLFATIGSRPPERPSTRPPHGGVDGKSQSSPPANVSPSNRPANRGTIPPPSSSPPPSLWHVRGHVLRATDHFILSAHGAAVRDRILARLPARYSDDFRHGSLTGVVLYELAVFEAYAAAANAIVLGNEPLAWRQIGRACVEGELASLMRTVSRGSDEAALFRRCTGTWSRLADFGVWTTLHRGDGETLIHVSEFGPAPLTLRLWFIGVVEQTLRYAGYTGTIVSPPVGEALRMPEIDLLVRLRT